MASNIDMQQILNDIKADCDAILQQRSVDGEVIYTDFNDYLMVLYPVNDIPKRLEFENKLKDLYSKCCEVTGSVEESRCAVYPPYLTAGVGHLKLFLWQLGFTPDAFIRGSTAAYNVLRVMEKDVLNGGNTAKYPIEVVPFCNGDVPGQGVEAFSLTTSIGSSVVTSAYLLCHWMLGKGYFNGPFSDVEKQNMRELAEMVKSVLHVSAVYEPVKDLGDAVFRSNKGKIEASQRPKPTILSYIASYSKVAHSILSRSRGRKSKRELVLEQVIAHNAREKVRQSKIKTDEIAAMKHVMEMSETFQRRMKIIYQVQSPQYTSCPTSLLAMKMLSSSTEPSVKKDENPVWYSIEEWSQEKGDAWLTRVDGKFNFMVQEVIAKGKKPNLLNQASQYRDTGLEHMVWVMACVKVWAWPEATKHNSKQRLDDLEQAWRRGALDDTLKTHVISKRKDFKASDIPWVGAPCQGVGAFGDVDPLGQQQQDLTDAQRKSIQSQFNEWAQRLKIEGGKHKLWLTEVDAFDSQKESDLQRFRNTRALTKDNAVKELCDSYYNSQGFSKKEQAMSYLSTKLTKVSDIKPPRAASTVLRLMWADMAELGLCHSRHVDEIIEFMTLACQHHKEVTAGWLCMPNTPKSGKGLKADATRDGNIAAAVGAVKTSLQTYTDLESQFVHGVIDPAYMYSNDRPVILEFAEVMSKERDAQGELCSLFAKGYTFRRRGVPELLKILHRSHFTDMSSKLSAASRGNLGEEKERKHWNSGRLLYKTLLKYIFEGMGLTPGARVVIQHITAWDPELAMACMEQNAAKASDMPTLTYVATGWTPIHPIICKNIHTMMSDELGHLIEKGAYTIPGYDANAAEPTSTASRPELSDNVFQICKPRYSSKELAIKETELVRVQALFGLDAALKKTLETTIEEFNKEHNPSGVPWKEMKRPTPDGQSQGVQATESESRGVFIKPCSKTVQELETDGAFVFKHTATPRVNMNFKLIVSPDGDKLYLTCAEDGVFYYPLGRFVGSFLQGQPAKSAMQGGSQWIEWKYENLDELVVACKKESSMAGPDVPPLFSNTPVPLKEFLTHLDKCGKTQYNMVSHKMDRDDIGKVTSITPEDMTCLPLPTSTPKKKTLSLDNVAGYIDIDAVKKSRRLGVIHNLVCPGENNTDTYTIHTQNIQYIHHTYTFT